MHYFGRVPGRYSEVGCASTLHWIDSFIEITERSSAAFIFASASLSNAFYSLTDASIAVGVTQAISRGGTLLSHLHSHANAIFTSKLMLLTLFSQNYTLI